MVLLKNGDLHGWGDNDHRQINPNSASDTWTDADTVIMGDVEDVICGKAQTVVISEDGDLYAWGESTKKQTNPSSDSSPWVDNTTIIFGGDR